MRVDEVSRVLDALDDAEVRYWLAGGWGVDALAGRETRPHRDLDLAVDSEHLDVCMAILNGLGYAVETDCLPVRVEVAAEGERWVDVHPVRFDEHGHGLQGDRGGPWFHYPPAAFGRGRLGERAVPCLTIDQQLIFHSGYQLRPQDEHDLGLLRALARKGGEGSAAGP